MTAGSVHSQCTGDVSTVWLATKLKDKSAKSARSLTGLPQWLLLPVGILNPVTAGPSTLDSTGLALPSPLVGGRALYYRLGPVSATPIPISLRRPLLLLLESLVFGTVW